jgi:hypothetical protein
MHSPNGALAAADNYVAAGLTDSLGQGSLTRFADAVVSASERKPLLDSSARAQGPPAGTSGVGVVVAHQLVGYTGNTARVAAWQLGLYWGPALVPSEYSALAYLTLRWMDGRWWIQSLAERVPGPVPALTPQAGHGDDTSSAFNRLLDGFTPVSYDAPPG